MENMKPDKEYTGRATIRMYNCDCMDLMKTGKKWDLAIVDPPYGIGEIAKKALSRARSTPRWKNARPVVYVGNNNWDSKPETEGYFSLLKCISKNQIIWGANHFIENITNANSPSWVTWYKKQNPNESSADCELAWTSFNTSVKHINLQWSGFGHINIGEIRIHPTQKPVKLYKWLLTNYAKLGDTILDTHGGSMSIAVACWDLGFDLDICELDKDYFAAAVNRFEDHIAQTTLF